MASRHDILPPRFITRYTLASNVSDEGGLTTVPLAQFTKLIRAIDPVDTYTTIGFDFSYVCDVTHDDSSTTYKHIVVSPYGFIVLVDPTAASTDPTTIVGRVITTRDASWTIKSDHDTYDTLLCPWFSKLDILCEDSYDVTTYTKEQSNRLDHGLDDPPIIYNKRKSGVWIKRCDHSPNGVRTIIRWYAKSTEYDDSNDVVGPMTFECVLYENGKIEFRYDRLSRIVKDTTTFTFLSSSYATCGVFPGTTLASTQKLWRDFSPTFPTVTPQTRSLSTYGGGVYDASWLDATVVATSYMHSLRPSLHWLGQETRGATVNFIPPMNRPQLLPRAVLRSIDGETGGSEQANFSMYDDRNSLAFVTQSVNYPTRLSRFSFGTTSMMVEAQEQFANDFTVTSSIARDFDKRLYARPQRRDDVNSFNEDRLFELEQSSSFFMSGTSLELIDGFNSRLASKTQIRLQIPVDLKTTLQEVTGSVLYFNFSKNTFQVIAQDDMRDALPCNTDPHYCDEFGWAYPKTPTTPGHSYRLFSPIGTSVVSGNVEFSEYDTNKAGASPADLNFVSTDAQFTKQALHSALQVRFKRDVLSCEDYVPSREQTFKLPIDAPFLIEKIVVDLPLEAGAGWFNDTTTCRPAAISELGRGFNYDFGGPGITLSLLHNCYTTLETERSASIRSLIASGVITHVNDMTSSIIAETMDDESAQVGVCLFKDGFSQFGNVAAVVPSSDGNFTGSVQVPMEAGLSNGMLLYVVGTLTVPPTENELKSLYTQQFIDGTTQSDNIWATFIQHINPFLRNNVGLTRSPEGRTIFGHQYAVPTTPMGAKELTQVPNPFYVDDTYANVPSYLTNIFDAASSKANAVAVVNVDKSVATPYLVYPNDELIIAISKTRPALSTSFYPTSMDYCTHHDVKINTGTIYMTLYGSYVREQKEFHDIKQRVNDSNAVYATVIGNSPVLDQFEVESEETLLGSYTDNYITGSLVKRSMLYNATTNITQLVTSSRGTLFSKKRWYNVPFPFWGSDGVKLVSQMFDAPMYYAGLNFVNRISSTTERVYDSMMPAFDQVMNADGVVLFRSQDIYIDAAFAQFDIVVTPSTFPSSSLISNTNWSYAFPFEPRYAAIPRVLQFAKTLNTKYVRRSDGLTLVTGSVQRHNGLFFEVPRNDDGNQGARHWGDVQYGIPPSKDNCAMSTNDTIRFIFGYSKTFDVQMMIAGPSGDLMPIGSNSRPRYSVIWTGDDLYVAVKPLIDGWKYGVYNGLPAYSSAVWRRGSFGQFRDMLEQRLDTKFFNEVDVNYSPRQQQNLASLLSSPVQVKFVDKDGHQTRPENTWSSNLSFEATSSVPYFDGEVKNRTAPNAVNMNLTLLNFTHDQFDNIKI